ncbi:MAG: phosphatase PAP2 family protein, partial [Cyclobacteriaceae bacterium]|nr:phosphatase PAP2 family protein [Cyclobacteriaceae bacterium]
MLDKINQLDIGLFELLNGAGHPALDSFMYVFTAKYPWIPLYALLTGLLVFRYRQRFWVPLLFILLTIAAADQLTSGFMKPFFERLRPCYNPDIVNLFNPGKCGGKFGFASSHAANTMALAVFYFLLFDRKWWTYLLIAWAFLVG